MSTESEKKRMQMIEEFIYIDDEARFEKKAKACVADLDYEFFDMITEFIQSAQKRGNEPLAATVWDVRSRLEALSTQGAAAVAEIDAKRGLVFIRDQDDLLERLISAENSEERLALIATAYDLIDEQFFHAISDKVTAAAKQVDRSEEMRLTELRSEVYDLKSQHVRRSREAAEQAETLFQKVLQAKRPDKVLERRASQINEAFFFIVGTNIAKARNQGQEEIAQALEAVGKTAAGLMHARMQNQSGPVA